MSHLAFIVDFWKFFFAPDNGPWFTGNVWGNVVAMIPCGIIGGLIGTFWAKSKYWPFKLLHKKLDRLHERHDEHAADIEHVLHVLEDLHARHDHLHAMVHEVRDLHAAECGVAPRDARPSGHSGSS